MLYPASSRALPTIAKGLAQLGAQVTQVEAYRTEAASLDVASCREWIERNEIGAVTFASPSAVIELERALGRQCFDKLFTKAAAVAIGPTTARARPRARDGRIRHLARAREHGLSARADPIMTARPTSHASPTHSRMRH